MNFCDFINYKNNCFYCNEELVLQPEINGMPNNIPIDYKIQDDLLLVDCKYIKFSFNIFSGELHYPEGYNSTINELLKKTYIMHLRCHCYNCFYNNESFYSYTGLMANVPYDTNRVEISFSSECVGIVNKYSLVIERENSWLYLADNDGKNKFSRSPMRLPELKLTDFSPEKLFSKLQTYIVFS